MRIGIISDSHDNLPALTKAVGYFNDADVDWVIHAGDLVSPFTSIPLKNLKAQFVAVYGNNDGEKQGLYNVFKGRIHRAPHVIEIDGKKIAILHEPDLLDSLVKSGDYDAVIYGHTHEVDIRKGPTLVVNPGELGGWVKGKRTLAIWDTRSNQIETIPV